MFPLPTTFIVCLLGSLVGAFGTGFILAICIEWPMMGLMKLAFPPNKPKQLSNGSTHNEVKINVHIEDDGTKATDLMNGRSAKEYEAHGNGGYLSDREQQTSL